MAAPRVLVLLVCGFLLIAAAVVLAPQTDSAALAMAIGDEPHAVVPAGRLSRPFEELAVTVQADTWLDEYNPHTNYGGDTDLRLGYVLQKDSKLYRDWILLAFDISKLPADATVNWAEVRLTQNGGSGYANAEVWAEYAAEPWDEGTAHWYNQPASSDLGDAKKTMDFTLGEQTVDATEIVRAWVGGSPVYGILLKVTDKDEVIHRFDAGTATLVIDYTVPVNTDTPTPTATVTLTPTATATDTVVPPRAFTDLGDAPDSSNSAGLKMDAYPGVGAEFPTVYGAGSPPIGPLHRNQPLQYFLGPYVSVEFEADSGDDEDGVNNLQPALGQANLELGDDGVDLPADWTHCQPVQLTFRVTSSITAASTARLNIWADWDGDGSWGGGLLCGSSSVPEWAVKNATVAIPGYGSHTFTTPAFYVYRPDAAQSFWLRVTLSDANATAEDGSGPAGGWSDGETEDYLIEGSELPTPTPTATATATATVTQTATPTATVSPIPSGMGALTLSGSGYVEITSDRRLNPASQLTIEGWIRRTALGENCQAIAAKNGDTGYWFGILNNRLRFSAGGQAVVGSDTLVAEQWIHVAVTHDGMAARVYANGILSGQASVNSPIPLNPDPLHLGSDRGQCALRGSLAHIHVWDRAFDQAEVRERMGRPVDSAEPGLLGGWGLVSNIHEVRGRYSSNLIGVATFDGPPDPGVITWDEVLVIPRIDDQFVLDGRCAPGEYGSLRVPIWYDDGHPAPNPVYAYVGAAGAHPSGSIAVCMENIDVASDDAAVYIDPDNGGLNLAGPTDYVIRAFPLPDGLANVSYSGDGAGFFTGPGLAAYATRYNLGDLYGSAEFRVPRSLLPSAGATLRMAFYHEGIGALERGYGYPTFSARAAPRTWARLRIVDGQLPRPDGAIPQVSVGYFPAVIRQGDVANVFADASDDVDLASVEIYLNGELAKTCTFPHADNTRESCLHAEPLPIGRYNVQARAIDHRGRIGSAMGTSFRVDVEDGAPRISVDHAPRTLSLGQQFTITARASDPSGLRRIQVVLDAPPYQVTCPFNGSTAQEPCSVTVVPGSRRVIRYWADATDMADFTAATEPRIAGLGASVQPGDPDSDSDGLPYYLEMALSLKPGDPDTDDDALLDGWEVLGLRFPSGEFTDLPALGANPYRKDVFVQYDYERGARAEPGVWERVIAIYRAAGITLHLTENERPRPTGDWPGGIPPPADTPSNWGPEWAAWHRDALGHYYFPPKLSWTHHYIYSRHSPGASSAWHHISILVNTGTCPLDVDDPQNDPACLGGSRDADSQVYAIAHELGHNLGLGHGGRTGDYVQWRLGDYLQVGVGGDWNNTNWKPNYISMMNYRYNRTAVCVDPSAPLQRGSAVIDFESRPMVTLHEEALSERASDLAFLTDLRLTTCPSGMVPVFRYTCGDSSGAKDILTDGSRVLAWNRWYPDGSPGGVTTGWSTAGLPVYTTPGVDWDCDGQIESATVAANINGFGSNDLWLDNWVGVSNEHLDARNDRIGLPHNPGSACAIARATDGDTLQAMPATYRNAIGATDCLISSATTPTLAHLTEMETDAATAGAVGEISASIASPVGFDLGPFVDQHTDTRPDVAELVVELCNGRDDDRDMLVDEDCPDSDGDKVVDGLDNCPLTPNTNQADADGDYLGDACGAPVVHHLSVVASGGAIQVTGDADTLDVRGYNVYRRCRGDNDTLRLGSYPTSEEPAYTDQAPGTLPCIYTMIAVNLNGRESGRGAIASIGTTAVYLPLVAR